MNIKNMDITNKDLNLLRTFLLLAKEKNLSQVANRLHLSQPALSYQLKKLREEFGDLLFIRTRQGYKLTERALELIPQIENILNSVEDLYNKPSFQLKEHRTEFKLATTSYFEMIVMESLLKRLKKKAPLVTIQTFSLSEKTTLHELADGAYDLAIAAFFSESLPKSYHLQKMGKDRHVCVMRKHHPIASQKWDIKKYVQAEHIKIDVPSGGVSRIDKLLQETKHPARNIVGRFNNFLTPALVVKNSDVILTCPEKLALFYKQQFDLDVRPMPTFKIELELQMVWHERKSQDPFQIWIRQELKEIFENYAH